jgi:GLPGLI family protein
MKNYYKMKKSVFLIFLFSQIVNAQIQTHNVYGYPPEMSGPRDIYNAHVADSSIIRVMYAFNATDIKDKKTYDELHCLETGSYMSKFYPYTFYISDSFCTEARKKGISLVSKREGGVDPVWSEYYSSEYFKDFSKNIFTEYTRMPAGLGHLNCQSSEDIPTQTWELHDDTLNILGYICQKATCRFRGRDYTAWFSLDIPISNGPWKFGGLPGLILKTYDIDKLYVFECISIESKKYPIMKYNFYEKRSTMERKKLLKLQKNIHENYVKVGGGDIQVWDKKTNAPYIPKKVVYYPMELE